jgi:hypothetical protein
MSSDVSSDPSPPNKHIPASYLSGDKTVDISTVFDLFKETFDRVQCLQRAILVMCEGHHDFKTEYARDMTELKRKLQDLGRNKVWIPRERIWHR